MCARLGEWLESPVQQAATAAAAEELRRRWYRQPAVRALSDAVAADPATLLDAARRFVLEAPGITALLDELIAAAASDPFFRPPFRAAVSEIHSGFLIFDSPELAVSLGTVSLEALAAKKIAGEGRGSIIFSGERNIVRFLRAGGARLAFWRAEPAGPDFTLEAAGECRLVGRRCVADGETIELDARSESFIIERASTDLVLLQANLRPLGPALAVEYDATTRQAISASNADEGESRLEMMVTLLRLLGADEALPLVSRTMSGVGFQTRWHLMRELLAWDAAAALPVLASLAEHDPHPEVRGAAAQTLALFFPQPARIRTQPPCLA
ncbi:MAG TPA: hypothetical protein VF727_01875 [Allosphingosinicella sp.]